MRGTCVLCGLVLAGCGFEHGALSTSEPDADIDAPDVDTDGDGVLDRLDNCPLLANTDQLDHDLDGHGDACDHCPHLASTSDPDSDSDGVGDACDPRPMIGGDKRVLWEGFYEPSSIGSWSRTGIWSVSDGLAHQQTATGEARMIYPTVFQHPYVETRFRIDALGGTSAQAGICTSIRTGQYYCCIVAAAGPTLKVTSYGTVTNFATPSWTGGFQLGDQLDVLENEVSNHGCSARQGSTTVTGTTTLGTTDGKFQLYMQEAGVSFDYVFVVEIGA